MRALFLLLVAANLAYFAWEDVYGPQQEPPPKVKMPRTSSSAGGTLTLLSEAPEISQSSKSMGSGISKEAEQVKEPPLPVAKNDFPAASPPRCYRISGFEKGPEVDAFTATLQQKGARLSGRGANQVTRSNYWVMIPPARSRAAAREVVSELQDHGTSDFYLVRGGEYANAISLGVFSTGTAALQRLRRIRALSLSGPGPRLDRREVTAKEYWLEVQWPDSEEPQWEGLVAKDSQIEVTSAPCRSPR